MCISGGVVLVAFATLWAVGCSPNSPDVKAQQSTSLEGKWVGKLQLAKAADDDAAAKMAEAFAAMLGSADLEIKPGYKYTLSMMGLPIEGSYSITGSKITLTPELIAGMTPEEAMKKGAEKGATEDPSKPLTGTVSADGTKITLSDEQGKDDSTIVFTRKPERKGSTATVSAAEAILVGDYFAMVDLTKVKPEERDEARAMQGGLGLSLFDDNTFEMKMIMSFEGKWKLVGDKLTLTVNEAMGMSGSEGPPAEFTVQGGTLVPVGPSNVPFTFVKKT